MRKIFGVVSLCAALLAGAVMGPSLVSAVYFRVLLSSNKVVFAGSEVSRNFAQMLVDYAVQYVINGAFGGGTSSRVAAIEKTIMAGKELVQAKLNSQAAEASTESLADADMTFGGQNVERACRISQEEKEAQNAFLNSHIELKSSAATAAHDFSDGGSATKVALERMKDHNENYCSEDAIKLNRCTKLSALPDADIQVSTLMSPEDSETMTREQYDASKAFIKMVTDPVPPEDMPKGLEKTSDGQRYLLERQQYTAAMTMAQQAYMKILAARTPGSLASKPAVPSSTSSTSPAP